MPFGHMENSTDKQLNKERIIDGFIYINYSNEKWINFRRVGGTVMKKKCDDYTLLFLAVNDIYMVINLLLFRCSVVFNCL